MQRPQKIKEILDKCKSCKKSFKGEANAKLRREKQKKSGFFRVSILLEANNANIDLKRHQKVGGTQHPNKSNEKP